MSTIPLQNVIDPFSQGGQTCASELDYNHAFGNVCYRDEISDEVSKFRVDVVSFDRSSIEAPVQAGARRIINHATGLTNLLGDGTIATIASNRARSAGAQRMTVMTIPQTFSNGPLSIKLSALQTVLRALDIPSSFLPVLYAFGSSPRISETGLDCFTHIPDPSNTNSFDVTYLYRLKGLDNPNSHAQISSWRDRQIGVFHRHNATLNEDLFLILQPHENSLFDGRLDDEVTPYPQILRRLLNNPLHLHQLLISSYFPQWREHLQTLGEKFLSCSTEVFTQDIIKDYSVNFESLQQWRDIADRVASVLAYLDSTLRIIDGLTTIHNRHHSDPSSGDDRKDLTTFLTSTRSQTVSLAASAKTFAQRINNVTELMNNTINIKNQDDAARLNEHMESLTLETVDDSTSVKTITYLTMFYLPGSFIATLFGMNLFDFNSATRSLDTTWNFWIYFVIVVPLTLLTVGAYSWLSSRPKEKRGEKYYRRKLLPVR